MIIGTDVSLDECRKEGYLMLEYDGRKKFDRTKDYRVFAYYPEYAGEKGLMIDGYVQFDDLYKTYIEHKKVVDKFCGLDLYLNFKNPTYHDLLNLTDCLTTYGLIDHFYTHLKWK